MRGSAATQSVNTNGVLGSLCTRTATGSCSSRHTQNERAEVRPSTFIRLVDPRRRFVYLGAEAGGHAEGTEQRLKGLDSKRMHGLERVPALEKVIHYSHENSLITVSGFLDSKIFLTKRRLFSIGWSKHRCNANGPSTVIYPSKTTFALSTPGVLRMRLRKRWTVLRSVDVSEMQAVPVKTFLQCREP